MSFRPLAGKSPTRCSRRHRCAGSVVTAEPARTLRALLREGVVARLQNVVALALGLEGGEVGVRRLDSLGVRLGLLVLGERPVDAREAGIVALALAGGDPQVGASWKAEGGVSPSPGRATRRSPHLRWACLNRTSPCRAQRPAAAQVADWHPRSSKAARRDGRARITACQNFRQQHRFPGPFLLGAPEVRGFTETEGPSARPHGFMPRFWGMNPWIRDQLAEVRPVADRLTL